MFWLKQYQQLLEKKTTEEEATTLRHELDFEEKRNKKTLHIFTSKT